MAALFSSSDLVQILLATSTSQPDAGDAALAGRIIAAGRNTLTIALRDASPDCASLFASAQRFVLRKTTSHGMLEYDASAELWRDDHGQPRYDYDGDLLLIATIHGSPREIQRREACRFPLRGGARYRLRDSDVWQDGELNDISQGGISLLLREEALALGLRVQLEFAIERQSFSVAAVVRRVEERPYGFRLYATEFVDLDVRERYRLARAIARLELRIIANHIRVN